MLKIGLTGGIGSGKTTVANYFKMLGVPIIDADEVSRRLVQPGLPAQEAIIQAFGAAILSSDNQLDRAKLRQLIFSDANAKLTLESILHPLIRSEIAAEIDSQISNNADYCIIAIPLLIETDQISLVDRVLVVDVEPEMQMARTRQRDGDSREQVVAIIKSQVAREDRCALADDVLDNNGDRAQLKRAVEKMHQQYLHLLRKPI